MKKLSSILLTILVLGCSSSTPFYPKVGMTFDQVDTLSVKSLNGHLSSGGSVGQYDVYGTYWGSEPNTEDSIESPKSYYFKNGILIDRGSIKNELENISTNDMQEMKKRRNAVLKKEAENELRDSELAEKLRVAENVEKKQEQSDEFDDSVLRSYGIQRSALDESQKQFFDIFMLLPFFTNDVNSKTLTRDQEKKAFEDNEKINKMGFTFDHKEGLSSVYIPRKDNTTYSSISNWTCVAMTNKKESENGQCKMIGDITWDTSVQSPVYYKKDIIKISGEVENKGLYLLYNGFKVADFVLSPSTWLMALFANPNNKDLISKAVVEDALPWTYRIHLKNVRIEIVKEFHEPLPNSGPKECQQDGLSMVPYPESKRYPCEYNSGPTKDDCGRPLDEVMDTLRSSGNYCYNGRIGLCYAFSYMDKSGSECPSVEEAPNYQGDRIRY